MNIEKIREEAVTETRLKRCSGSKSMDLKAIKEEIIKERDEAFRTSTCEYSSGFEVQKAGVGKTPDLYLMGKAHALDWVLTLLGKKEDLITQKDKIAQTIVDLQTLFVKAHDIANPEFGAGYVKVPEEILNKTVSLLYRFYDMVDDSDLSEGE